MTRIDSGITLFLRTYPNDYKWLEKTIPTWEKHLHCIEHAIVCIPQTAETPPHLEFFDTIVRSYKYDEIDGYIAQQFDKLESWKYVDTEFTLFLDSDCFLYGDILPHHLFEVDSSTPEGPRDKPILLRTSYDHLGDEVPWKKVVKDKLGIDASWEYMRCLPLLHNTKVIKAVTHLYPNLILNSVNERNREFSEFNFIGAVADVHYPHLYCFKDTEKDKYTPLPCKNFWSWSGLNSEDLQMMELLSKDD